MELRELGIFPNPRAYIGGTGWNFSKSHGLYVVEDVPKPCYRRGRGSDSHPALLGASITICITSRRRARRYSNSQSFCMGERSRNLSKSKSLCEGESFFKSHDLYIEGGFFKELFIFYTYYILIIFNIFLHIFRIFSHISFIYFSHISFIFPSYACFVSFAPHCNSLKICEYTPSLP